MLAWLSSIAVQAVALRKCQLDIVLVFMMFTPSRIVLFGADGSARMGTLAG